MHVYPRRLRLCSATGPLLLYLLIAGAMLWPYRHAAFRFAGDLWVVIGGISEARNGLAEGQFPLRVAPHLNGGARYPLFQYYGNLPYTAAGAICLALAVNAYTAWKLVTLASLTVGGYFAFRLAHAISRDASASVVAGAVFLLAPYQLTDMNARGAFAECVAFNLIPMAFYYLFRTLASGRWKYVALCAFAWSLLAFSHNIAYACAVLFAVPFCLYFLGSRWRARLPRLAVMAALHALLVLWYFVPQILTLGDLNIRQESGNPYEFMDVAPLRALLSPVLTNTPRGESWPGLGMQIGWPMLGGVLLAVVMRVAGRRSSVRWVGPILALFLVAFVVVWSPFDFWRWLPHVFWVVQFPYRLLMLVVLWGSVLGACGLAAMFRRGMSAAAVGVVLFLVGMSVASYVPPRSHLLTDRVATLSEHPDMGQTVATAYLLAPQTVAATSLVPADSTSADWAAVSTQLRSSRPGLLLPGESQIRRGDRVRYDCGTSEPALLVLPVLYYPRMLDVRDKGRRVSYGNIGRFAAVRLRPGSHQIAMRYRGSWWANLLSGLGWIVLAVLFVVVLFRGGVPRRPGCGFPVRHAILGFIAILAGAGLALAHPVERFIIRNPVVTVTGGTQASPEEGPQAAFDGDYRTAWISADSGPNSITVRPSRPARLKKITFFPRVTPLYEGWSHVRVVLWLGGRQVYAKDVDFPDAAHRRADVLRVRATLTDRIDLDFSRPVLETRDGGARLEPQQVRPGYNEIDLTWQR